jgi:hypothetical protein
MHERINTSDEDYQEKMLFLRAMGAVEDEEDNPLSWERKQERGRQAEALFAEAMVTPFPGQPDWLRLGRRATEEEDRHQKKDFVFHLDVGEVYYQIKSDVVGYNRFKAQKGKQRELRNHIPFHVGYNDTVETIRARVLQRLREKRSRLQQQAVLHGNRGGKKPS